MQDTALVVKDNRLIEASYKLTEAEQRIMMMAIAWTRINVVDELTTDTWIELQSKDYISLFETDNKNAYRQLKMAIKALASRKLMVEVIDPITLLPAILETDWVTNALYVEGAGLVRINLGKMIIPYIWKLEHRFTSYQIKSVKQLSGGYTVRLYELLLQYLIIGHRTFQLDELREVLDAQGKAYDRINNFKARVLDYAVQQINQLTDIEICYETIKTGRSVSGFIFHIKSKKKNTQSQKETPKLENKKTVKPNISIETLTLAEKNMLKKLISLTGKTEKTLLQEASAFEVDAFLALDKMLKNI
jgi:plasmid replication initiation protein